MRKTLLVALFVLSLLLPLPSWGAIALVSSVNGKSTNTNGFTTPTFNSTGATFLVCNLTSSQAATEPVITDSNTNIWLTTLTPQAVTANVRAHLIYAVNPTVGAGHTITVTGNTTFPAVVCVAFSGVKLTAPADVENGAVTSVGANSLQVGSVATAAGAVAITGYGALSAAPTIDAGFTIQESVTTDNVNYYTTVIAYLLNAGTVNPTWSWGGGIASAASPIASFLPAPAGTQAGPGFLGTILK